MYEKSFTRSIMISNSLKGIQKLVFFYFATVQCQARQIKLESLRFDGSLLPAGYLGVGRPVESVR